MATHRRGTSAAQWLVADLLRREGRPWPSLSPAARGLAVGGALLCSTVVAVSMAGEPQVPEPPPPPDPEPPVAAPPTPAPAAPSAAPTSRTLPQERARRQPSPSWPTPNRRSRASRGSGCPPRGRRRPPRASRSTATPWRPRRSGRPAGTPRTTRDPTIGRTATRPTVTPTTDDDADDRDDRVRRQGRGPGRRHVRRAELDARPGRRHVRTTRPATWDRDGRRRRPRR